MDQSQHWRVPTEPELANFRANCWPTDSTIQFSCESLSPTEDALRLYHESGKKQMLNINEESYPASVCSDYITREEEETGGRVESPRKKARSVKTIHIPQSPIRPKRPALLHKVVMALPEPPWMAANHFLSNPPRSPPPDAKSIVTLPNLPSNSDNIRTPIRQRTPIDPYLTATPYNRGHRTSRKYLCARCIDVQLLCCWISFNIRLLQASHLVPHCLEKPKYRQLLDFLRRAIGGRFSVNSRVNYILLYQAIHTSFDRQGAIAYPIQPYVLDAVDEYLKWLDSQDGGVPWVNGQDPVDYFKFLRSEHPFLSDGHQYVIRFTALKPEDAVDIILYKKYTELGQNPDWDTVVRAPYTQLSTRMVFANPIFLLLNLIHQFEKTFTRESLQDQEVWRRTREQWKDWVEESPKLKHLVGQEDLDPFTNKVYSSVDGLARALAIAGHLRRRLPSEFQWVIEKNMPEDDDSDVFSNPSTSHPASQDGPSSSQRVPGPYIPLGDPTAPGGGSTLGRGNNNNNNTRTGGERKEAKAQTDCAAMVEEWREQNPKPAARSLWHKLRMSLDSRGNANRDKGSGGSMTSSSNPADQTSVSVGKGIRLGSIRKVFGAIVNRG